MKIVLRNIKNEWSSYKDPRGVRVSCQPRHHMILEIDEKYKSFYQALSREGFSIYVIDETKKEDSVSPYQDDIDEDIGLNTNIDSSIKKVNSCISDFLSKDEILLLFDTLDDPQPRKLTKQQLVDKLVESYE